MRVSFVLWFFFLFLNVCTKWLLNSISFTRPFVTHSNSYFICDVLDKWKRLAKKELEHHKCGCTINPPSRIPNSLNYIRKPIHISSLMHFWLVLYFFLSSACFVHIIHILARCNALMFALFCLYGFVLHSNLPPNTQKATQFVWSKYS